ncbi:hypothetical protein R1flu_010043 [Riccia fluitans]|uniref:Uncharacterized protein n=1 Tax=Riccia fluitans TaxID=41844 RepID=A0ABD1Z3V7_9MARC
MSIGYGALPAAALQAERAGKRAVGWSGRAPCGGQPPPSVWPLAGQSALRAPAATVHVAATLKHPRGRFRVRE